MQKGKRPPAQELGTLLTTMNYQFKKIEKMETQIESIASASNSLDWSDGLDGYSLSPTAKAANLALLQKRQKHIEKVYLWAQKNAPFAAKISEAADNLAKALEPLVDVPIYSNVIFW